jgi:ribosomal protein S12 methylthiotransferase accessory factor YcaO
MVVTVVAVVEAFMAAGAVASAAVGVAHSTAVKAEASTVEVLTVATVANGPPPCLAAAVAQEEWLEGRRPLADPHPPRQEAGRHCLVLTHPRDGMGSIDRAIAVPGQRRRTNQRLPTASGILSQALTPQQDSL